MERNQISVFVVEEGKPEKRLKIKNKERLWVYQDFGGYETDDC